MELIAGFQTDWRIAIPPIQEGAQGIILPEFMDTISGRAMVSSQCQDPQGMPGILDGCRKPGCGAESTTILPPHKNE
ncbi:MAG: hypothetical protein Kow0089_07630 [Desulfobulbaceae bacterium]